MSDSEQDKEPDVPEELPPVDAGISHLMAVSIQINEMFKHLKSAGFTQEEALQLSGIVLSSGVLFRYPDFEFDDDSDFEDEERHGLDEDGGDFI